MQPVFFLDQQGGVNGVDRSDQNKFAIFYTLFLSKESNSVSGSFILCDLK